MTILPRGTKPVAASGRAERPHLAYGNHPPLTTHAADSPESLKTELRTTVSDPPAEIRELIEGFTPLSLAPADWARVREFVTAAILAVAPLNRHTFRQLSAAVVSLISWAHLERGFPLKYRLVLSAEVVTKWQEDQARTRGLSAGTVRNYRGHIARVAHVLGVEPDPQFDPIHRVARAIPYSAQELDAIWLWTRTLTPRSRHRAQVVVALAAGAGLRPAEIASVRAKQVISHAGMWIRVGEPAARMVPVGDKWKPEIRALSVELQSNQFLLSRAGDAEAVDLPLTNLGTPTRFDGPVRADRLRASWVVAMLGSGLDDAATLAYSGMERGETLAGYLPFLGAVDASRRIALIRMRTAGSDAAHRDGRGHLLGHSRSTAEAGGNDD